MLCCVVLRPIRIDHITFAILTKHFGSFILICIWNVEATIPTIIHEECSAVNNSVTVAWKASNPLSNDGYVLEMDDGSRGEFRVSSVFDG